MKVRNLYMAKGLPVFQNKMFSSKEKGIACPQGDIILVQNLETGFITIKILMLVYLSMMQITRMNRHIQMCFRCI